MPAFLIQSTHTSADCSMVLQDYLATGFLTHFDWGCKDGEHMGWAIIEAANRAEAMLVVPPSARMHARAIQIVKFSPDEVRAMHRLK